MIMRIILILIIGGCILLGACQDITPGYLQTEYAGYTMDSMVVKKVLDRDVCELWVYSGVLCAKWNLSNNRRG